MNCEWDRTNFVTYRPAKEANILSIDRPFAYPKDV